MNQSIMAIGAHADDIEIHLGGTLAKYHALGYEVVYVMATNNMAGRVSVLEADGSVRSWREGPADMMARRKRECDEAAAEFDTTPIHLDHPQRHYWSKDGEFFEVRYGAQLPVCVPKDVPSILTAGEDEASLRRLANLILERDPECVFTHGVSQMDPEHFGASLLATKSYWLAVEDGYRGALLQWRGIHTQHGEFNCRWETFIDFTPLLGRKMQLIGIHRCQMPKAHLPDFGHRVLAKRWGAASGCGAAEPFIWVRHADFRDILGMGYPPLTLELIRNTR